MVCKACLGILSSRCFFLRGWYYNIHSRECVLLTSTSISILAKQRDVETAFGHPWRHVLSDGLGAAQYKNEGATTRTADRTTLKFFSIFVPCEYWLWMLLLRGLGCDWPVFNYASETLLVYPVFRLWDWRPWRRIMVRWYVGFLCEYCFWMSFWGCCNRRRWNYWGLLIGVCQGFAGKTAELRGSLWTSRMSCLVW